MRFVSFQLKPRNSNTGFKSPKVGATSLLLFVLLMPSMAWLSGCAGVVSGNNPNPSPQGAVLVSPVSLAFGNVAAGQKNSRSISITNNSTSSITVMTAAVSGAQITTSGMTLPLVIAAGQTATFNVLFGGTTTGVVSGTLTLEFADGNASTVTITGTIVAAAAQLSVTPASVDFGPVAKGTSNSQTLQIKNEGNTALTISQVSVFGAGFSTSGLTAPVSLAAGAGGTFNVHFSPQSSGNASGTVTIVSNAPNSSLTIALTGSQTAAAHALTVSPSSLGFGNVAPGSSTVQNITITNTGNTDVAISRISSSGSAFSVTGAGTPLRLSPSQTVSVGVHFSPSTTGAANGSVTIASDATGSPAAVPLSGTGVVATAHSVALTWNQSTSSVAGYNVYRSTVSGSAYTKLTGSLVSGLSFTDSNVVSGQTYFYVTTAEDFTGRESISSNEAEAIIP